MIGLANSFMNPYYINIAILIFLGLLTLKYKTEQSKKLFVIIATSNWVILSGFRHISIGADTDDYLRNFNQILWTSWRFIFNSVTEIYLHGAEGKDPGYSVFVKFTQIFTDDYQMFLIIVALVFTIPLGIWIYKNSKSPFISFLLYSTLFYSFFSITGARQTVATAIGVLVGYKYIKERRLLPFTMLILLSLTIHKSILVFYPFYFIANIKITKKHLIAMFFTFPIIMYFRVPISLFFQELSGYNYGIYEGAGPYNFTFLLIIIAIIATWKHKIILSRNPTAKNYYNALIVSVLTVPLTFVNPSAMRVVQYYSIFLMLLLPEIIGSFKKVEKIIVYYLAMGILLLLFIRNNPQYMFFWK